jgi:uroporphyrinogen decarboxylase
MMWAEPETFALLMGKISEVIRRFLRAQVAAGAQVVQLFDSWVGSLSPNDYRTHVFPHVAMILRDLETTGVPVIHFGTNTGSLLELQREAGGTVLGCDWRTPLHQAWKRVGYDRALQGNLDPLLLHAPWQVLEPRVREVLAQAEGRPGHIFNLGHGITPGTPPDNVRRVVELVHSIPRSSLEPSR